MRKINQKIFAVAKNKEPGEVSVSQLLTDVVVEEMKTGEHKLDKNSINEASNVLQTEQKKVVKGGHPSPSPQKAPTKITPASRIRKPQAQSIKKNNNKSDEKKPNMQVVALLGILIAGVAYYLYTELM